MPTTSAARKIAAIGRKEYGWVVDGERENDNGGSFVVVKTNHLSLAQAIRTVLNRNFESRWDGDSLEDFYAYVSDDGDEEFDVNKSVGSWGAAFTARRTGAQPPRGRCYRA